MSSVHHFFGIVGSTTVILMIFVYSILHEPSVTRLPTRSQQPAASFESSEPVLRTEVAVFEPQNAVMSGDQFLYSFDFQGQLVDINPVGPPGKMEYILDIEDMRERGFLISESRVRDLEIGRAQKYDLQFEADNGALIVVRGIQASAYADCKIELLLFKDGVYPQDLRPLLPGAGIN